MMKIIENPKRKDWERILKRPTQTYSDIEPLVSEIFQNVMTDGDKAIKRYTEKFDRAKLDKLEVSSLEIEQAKSTLDDSLKEAIKLAKKNIEAFHASQQSAVKKIESTPGVVCWQEKRAIEKVGLYIPGGTAPLFSTILMLAVPAAIAGCEEVIMCTPCNDKGEVHPAVLYTADLCRVTRIFKAGGIQAIAGMTLGTETIPKVYKIFGPGNQFVTVAKQMAMKYGVGIDLPAGPSELLVYADTSSTARFSAADLLSQAEHGTDSQVILVSNSLEKLDEIKNEIHEQLQQLPRKDIASKAMENSKLIYCNDGETAIDLINFYAPEHLILSLEDTISILPLIKNAGSVFVGDYSPESAGDYASGTNHTLPTNGFAKNYSGVNLDAFQKAVSFQQISKSGLRNIGSAIEKMAEAEGLFAHQNAVTLRLSSLQETNASES